MFELSLWYLNMQRYFQVKLLWIFFLSAIYAKSWFFVLINWIFKKTEINRKIVIKNFNYLLQFSKVISGEKRKFDIRNFEMKITFTFQKKIIMLNNKTEKSQVKKTIFWKKFIINRFLLNWKYDFEHFNIFMFNLQFKLFTLICF